MKKNIIYLITITLLFAGLTACGTPANDPEGNTAAPAGDDAISEADQEAMAVFRRQCVSCHAADLSGRVGEQSNLRQVGARLDKDQIADVIRNGGQIMPPQKITEDEIELLAGWLSTLK